MNWTMWGALGEVGGALAVVASLLYLARQIHLSNLISEAEAYRAVWLKSIDVQLGWAKDPHFREVLPKVYMERMTREELSPEERTVAGLYFNAFLNVRALVHQEVKQGILPTSALELFGSSAVRLPYMRGLWQIVRPDYPEDFQRYYDETLRSSDSQLGEGAVGGEDDQKSDRYPKAARASWMRTGTGRGPVEASRAAGATVW